MRKNFLLMKILIIGATSGIGHGLWRHYVTLGNEVAVTGRRRELLDDMAHSYPELTYTSCCDIADTASFDSCFENVLRHFGSLDLVIVCAGIGELNPQLDPATELSTIAVNVAGWTNAVDKAYNQLSTQGYGRLVTITSVGGLQPAAAAPSYSASKAFQINYTRSLQRKSKGTPVAVTEIRPGLVDTRMAKGDGLFWVMPVDRVVKMTVKAIARRQRLAVVTRRWRLINLLLRHLP